jgi:hypothetical protein
MTLKPGQKGDACAQPLVSSFVDGLGQAAHRQIRMSLKGLAVFA